MNIAIPKKILQEIESGKYKKQYLIYCRKSTDDSESQQNSLGHQKQEISSFVLRNNVQIADLSVTGFCTDGVISESHSGFKEDDTLEFAEDGSIKYKIERPKFNLLVQLLHQKQFAGIVCMSWDRLSRNKSDNAIMTKLIRKGLNVQFVSTTYDQTSSGMLHMDMDGSFAIHHSRVTREKVTNAMHRMRDEGIVVYKAPLGYVNTGKKFHQLSPGESLKPFDPERAPIVKEIFEKYATGEWSMSDLSRWANEQGLTNFATRRKRTKEEMLSDEPVIIEPREKPIDLNNIYYILDNRFYIGMMQNSQGSWIPSKSHEPLISLELFEKVQKIRHKKTVSIRYRETLGHALRGVMRCAECSRLYTPYTKKGIQYFGSRCRDDCSNTKKSCNLKFIEDEVGEYVGTLYLTPEELEELDQSADTGIAFLEAKAQKEREQVDRQKRKINEDLTYLRSNRLQLLKSGVYDPESYQAEEKRLIDALPVVEEQVQITQEALHKTICDAIKLSELLKNLTVYYQEANHAEKEVIIRTIFSELLCDDKTFICSLKPEFRALNKENIVSSAPPRS